MLLTTVIFFISSFYFLLCITMKRIPYAAQDLESNITTV